MKGKARIGKRVLFCEKGSAEEKGKGSSSKNRPKSDLKRGEQEKMDYAGQKNGSSSSKNCLKSGSKRGRARKKSTSQGKKWERFLEESLEIGFEMEKSKKNGDFGAKKVGWGRGEKMGFTADFAML